MKVRNDVSVPVQTGRMDRVGAAKDRVSLGKSPKPEGTESPSDVKVSLSERAQDMMLAKRIAQETPEVRPERVQNLKEMIKSGKYKVDSAALADRMVDEALAEI